MVAVAMAATACVGSTRSNADCDLKEEFDDITEAAKDFAEKAADKGAAFVERNEDKIEAAKEAVKQAGAELYDRAQVEAEAAKRAVEAGAEAYKESKSATR